MSVIVKVCVDRCDKCPHIKISRTFGAGYAHDFTCTVVNKIVAEYVEYAYEMPSIPSWCPFKEEEGGLK